MNLTEYLNQRYTKAKVLTLREAKVIGIPWPLPGGWPKKFAATEIDDDKFAMLDAIVKKYIERKDEDAKTRKQRNASKTITQNERIRAELEQRLGRPLSSNVSEEPKKPKPKKQKAKSTKAQWKYDGFYETREWRELRYKALVKHGAACQCCGATRTNGVRIHVDHIKPRSKWPSLQLDINNLQVLCEDCNLGKSNKDDTDWR